VLRGKDSKQPSPSRRAVKREPGVWTIFNRGAWPLKVPLTRQKRI